MHICYSSAHILVGRFTLQCLLCPFWHFGPYWLSVKVLGLNAWCHIFAGDAFYYMPFHISMWCEGYAAFHVVYMLFVYLLSLEMDYDYGD